MRWLPWIVIALFIVSGLVLFMLIKNPTQRASITAGEPVVSGAGGPAPGDSPYI